MISGIINVYKPQDMTSFAVVARLRKILQIKKIGHTGTLDPMATGVLPICVGRATKLVSMLTDEDKVYETCMQLGVMTDTQDMTGTILCEKEVNITEDAFYSVLPKFLGEIEQIPPMYSAKKVGGKRLYTLAREGVTVERKPSLIQIHSIEVMSFAPPYVRLSITCSKGTYIRTLLSDIGDCLGCGASMAQLSRIRVGRFHLSDAYTLSEIEEHAKDNDWSFMTSVDTLFEDLTAVYAKKEADRLIQNGNALSLSFVQKKNLSEGQMVRLYQANGQFAGISQCKDHQLVLVKNFLSV